MFKYLLFLISFCLVGQPTRGPFHPVVSGGGGAPSDVPTWLGNFDYRVPLEDPPTLAVGEGWRNSYGKNCILKLAADGMNDYVYPQALNLNNNWVTYNASGGGRRLLFVGTPVITTNSCSITVGTPRTLTIPVDVTPNEIVLAHWSPIEPYVLYVASGNGGGNNQKLYEYRCSSSCTSDSAVWAWGLVKDFSGSDGVGPYIDWNNAAFCMSGTGPSCTRVSDYAGIKLYLYNISPNGNYFTFSLRGGSKSEYAMCGWSRSPESFNCYYTENNGTMPGSVAPAPGGSTHKGNGPAFNFNPETTGYITFQVGNNASTPKWYRKVLPTSRVGTWANAESLTGTLPVGHGAPTNTSQITVIDYGNYLGTCTVSGIPFNNYTYGYLEFTTAGSIPVSGAGTSYNVVLDVPYCSYGGGWHIGSSTFAPKYHIATFYRHSYSSAFGFCETVDGARAGCHELVAVSTQVPYHIIRLGQHFSWCYDSTAGYCTGYDSQGHGNVSFNGRYIIFKSNWQNTLSGAKNPAVAVGLYMMVIGDHVTF